MSKKLGGTFYWRQAGLTGNAMRTVMSRRIDAPEISAAEAADLNARRAGFDNAMSQVFEQRVAGIELPNEEKPPFADSTDWISNSWACGQG